MTRTPQITAAFARGRGQFCIALAELEYDDLFTAVIEYDDRFPQPWSRTDIERKITRSHRHALLSHEGDFYLTGPSPCAKSFPAPVSKASMQSAARCSASAWSMADCGLSRRVSKSIGAMMSANGPCAKSTSPILKGSKSHGSLNVGQRYFRRKTRALECVSLRT